MAPDNTIERAALMKDFLRSPAWDCLKDYLNTMIQIATDRAILGTKDEFDFRKGVIMGLKDALALPQSIISYSEASKRP